MAAAPTLQASGALTAVTTGDVSPTVPVGHQAGDILFAQVILWAPSTVAATAVIPTPSTWTKIEELAFPSVAADGWIACFWKRATGGSETVTFTRDAGWDTGNDSCFAAVVDVIRGCISTGTPYDDSSVSAVFTTANQNVPAVTVVGNNRLMWNAALNTVDSASAQYTAQTSYTMQTATARGTTTGTGAGSRGSWLATSSSQSAAASTHTAPTAGRHYAFISVAFSPPKDPVDGPELDLKWDLEGETPVDGPVLDLKWDLEATAPVNGPELELVWDLQGEAPVDGPVLELVWDLEAPVPVNGPALDLVWDIGGTAPVDGPVLELIWDMGTPVDGAVLDLKWDVASAVDSGVVDFKWDVAGAVDGAVLELVWDLEAEVVAVPVDGLELLLVWNLAGPTVFVLDDYARFPPGTDVSAYEADPVLDPWLTARQYSTRGVLRADPPATPIETQVMRADGEGAIFEALTPNTRYHFVALVADEIPRNPHLPSLSKDHWHSLTALVD